MKNLIFILLVVSCTNIKNKVSETTHEHAVQPEEKFDAVLSRAFASMTDMVEWCHHLPKEQSGVFLALKGQHPRDEIDLLPEWCSVTDIKALQVPELDGERHLVTLSRQG